jgi:hypothetical protein
MSWARNIARRGTRNTYTVLVKKAEEKRPLERPSNVVMDIREMRLGL